DAVAHFQFMILNDQLAGGRRQVVGVAPSVGLRYLFSEEGLRPYAGLDLSFLLTFREVGIRSYFGLGPNIGLDYFLSDTFSIGVRGQYNLYVALNTPLQTAIGAQLVLATYF
ncbi:MAG TPA: hypothetical protein VEY30_00985, partial [Myxococcaceae bacterium]|nr:hypothetical protein [Myxococcaceae bacterium]